VSAWRAWVDNGLPSKQIALYRTALQFGYSYLLVTPGTKADGSASSVIRGVSPQRGFAVYADPANDEWPVYALKREPLTRTTSRVLLYDDTFVHTLMFDSSSDKPWSYVGREPHGAGCVPWIRYAGCMDLDGNCIGEVEPAIHVASKIDKTNFDVLLIQHHNSWKKYIVSGLAGSSKEQAMQQAENVSMVIKQNDIITAPDGVKVDTLEETSVQDLLKAGERAVQELSSVTQVPSYLLGEPLINVNPDALEAQRWGMTQHLFELQQAFGQSHEQALRLAAQLAGDVEAAEDFNSRVTWQDASVRSWSQAADALGKYAQMLGVPKRGLWPRIPNTTQADLQEWESMALSDDPLNQVLNGLSQGQPSVNGRSIPDAHADGEPGVL